MTCAAPEPGWPVLTCWGQGVCPCVARVDATDPGRGSGDAEGAHHPGVLMFELVAVNQVALGAGGHEPGVEANQNVDLFPVVEQDGVLPAGFPGEELGSAAPSGNNLERGAVDVDRMGGVAVGDEGPLLDHAGRYLEVDAVHRAQLPAD